MSQLLYDGAAGLRLLSDVAMRGSAPRHIETLRVTVANASAAASEGENVAAEVREAAKYATALARDLRSIATSIEGAAELATDIPVLPG